jgi:anti-sigma factor RsiW
MSLSETELIYLMAYVDGQVDDDELPEVEALLERSEEARQIVAQHAALGDWVRDTSDARAAAAGVDLVAKRVVAEIEQVGGAEVILLERERARLALRRQRIKEFGALFAIAAAAAAFWLMPETKQPSIAVTPSAELLRSVAPAPQPSSLTGQVLASADPVASSATAAAADPDTEGVEVQAVDSPSHPFSIFYLPVASGIDAHASSVVVWIDE